MTKLMCQKLVRDKHDLHTDGWHGLVECGKPAKYMMTMTTGTILLCGIHARKHIRANIPWRKVTPLKEVKP